jgi:hypothetical protein
VGLKLARKPHSQAINAHSSRKLRAPSEKVLGSFVKWSVCKGTRRQGGMAG